MLRTPFQWANGILQSKAKRFKKRFQRFFRFQLYTLSHPMATRKNPSIKEVPKSMDQILSKKRRETWIIQIEYYNDVEQ